MAWASSSLDNDFRFLIYFFFLTCGFMGTVQKAACPLVPARSDISSATVHVESSLLS